MTLAGTRPRTARRTAAGGTRPHHKPARGRRSRSSLPLTLVMAVMLGYAVVPLLWLVISATKTNAGLFTSPGLWFADDVALWDNIVQTFSYQDGVYTRWLLNTMLYAGVGAGGATVLAAMGGYALAKFDFPGRRLMAAVVIGGAAVPLTALAVPTFLLFSRLGLVNTPWAVIIPALVSPFGLYLMRIFAAEAVPDSLLEAARIDGAGELRIFLTVALRLLAPGAVTVLLFTLVATWNNYFLPLIMINDPRWYPLTVGLNQWNSQIGSSSGGEAVYNIMLTGSLLAVVPLVVAFLLLQRYWQSGLAAGSVKQ
ncbi:carbohydrate ABC transporter permease [Marinactinospora rubrisoli]|uniref:Carbohydrate ABC transporter permease n=1 Tax=Marinactinospora rubrisoli TaxID=2715399 RepID=A0ABW2K893_9ACTN